LITAPLPPAKENSIGELVAVGPARALSRRLGIKKTGEFSNAISGELHRRRHAILNANFVAKRLAGAYDVLYSGAKGVAHECIVDTRPLLEEAGQVLTRNQPAGQNTNLFPWPNARENGCCRLRLTVTRACRVWLGSGE
jgi:glycine dehydrogenase-like protein